VALVVLDASVVIGFLDPKDALHRACVDAFAAHQRDELVIPVTVYAEILVAPFRVGAEAVSEVEAFLTDFAIRIGQITPSMARAAVKLRSGKRGLRLPDALVIAFGDENEADAVLTSDQEWSKVSERAVLVASA
jgi:predicted nucleic acid-binding protein